MTPAQQRFLNQFEKIAVQVIDRDLPLYKRPISGIIGRQMSPYYAAALGSLDPLRPGPSAKDKSIQEVIDAYKDDPDLKDTKVYLNNRNVLDSVRDILRNKKTGVGTKAFGLLTALPISWHQAKSRSDHYDPMGNAVTVYTKNPGILAHELGHAKDFQKSNKTGLRLIGAVAENALVNKAILPFGPLRLKDEAKANLIANEALKKTKSYKDDIHTRGMLGASFGSYLGGAAAGTKALLDYRAGKKPSKWLALAPFVGGLAGRGIGTLAQHIANKRRAAAEAKELEAKKGRK